MKMLIKKNLIYLLLLVLSALLFIMSFPGFISEYGIAYFSFIALIPMFYVVYKMSYIQTIIFGFIYGMGKYLLFNYWLKAFDPAAYAVAPAIHGIYFLMLFPCIRYLYNRFPKYGFIHITILWLSYELFKSTNVVGYSYGILSQSMYKTHHFTGIVDIIGSYLLSSIIVFPSIFITFIHRKKVSIKSKTSIITIIVYITIFISSILYTQLMKVDYSNSDKIKVTLVQHNLNCWLKGNDLLYSQAYDHLEELSIQGESENSDLIIWPETSFVPAIEWHKKYRPTHERNRLELIKRMESYLKDTKAFYIIGNNESFGKDRDTHYNSAYLYKSNKVLNKYRKINLVPFTERFPYPEKFPWLFNYVKKLGAKQIEPGEEQVLFQINNYLATTLICYEDAFSDLPRQGVKSGSDLFINITNDAWTSSPTAALQHLAAAALRTIENRRTLVRAGTSGFTGIIDPNGKIIKSLPLFVKDQLTYDIPIYNSKVTFYTRYGAILDLIPYILLSVVVLISIFLHILERKKI